ncbi:trehalose 6-phosphate phosphatase [Thermogymnomonas acidicola]|uniref:Trehalose 6-phosphate phosphatase n=2 Tax=Thermogymnomonas acidicola TaxID=399579 RepID=A0AA37BR63_9ARCH|nr:trehalose 6-phosphate phosphatase [Thermogymnomonas acidicola]
MGPGDQVFLDYDGTLVPISSDPTSCFADRELLSILDGLGEEYDMYIVTGRSAEDMRRFLPPRYRVIALHGALLLTSEGDVPLIPDYSRYVEICNSIALRKNEIREMFHGARLYNKVGGITVNTWLMDTATRGRLEDFMRSLAEESGMELYLGKQVVELRIPGVNKGDAIRKFRKHGRKALIAGDDITDEEAFIKNSDALTVKVGPGETSARYRVSDYMEMRSLLRELIRRS